MNFKCGNNCFPPFPGLCEFWWLLVDGKLVLRMRFIPSWKLLMQLLLSRCSVGNFLRKMFRNSQPWNVVEMNYKVYWIHVVHIVALCRKRWKGQGCKMRMNREWNYIINMLWSFITSCSFCLSLFVVCRLCIYYFMYQLLVELQVAMTLCSVLIMFHSHNRSAANF